MRHSARVAFAAVLAAAAFATPAAAQSDILLRLRSGSPLGDRFRIDSAGGVVARGNLGIGIIPESGNPSGGVRMMWYPFKGSFRAGAPGGTGATNWDDANLGFYNWSGGYETRATGIYSFAMGDGSTTSGQSSFAIGEDSEAAGSRAVAMGLDSRAMSISSFAARTSISPVLSLGLVVPSGRRAISPVTRTTSSNRTLAANSSASAPLSGPMTICVLP